MTQKNVVLRNFGVEALDAQKYGVRRWQNGSKKDPVAYGFLK